MFWKKLFIINITIIYIALKLYVFISSSISSDKNSLNTNPNISQAFKDLRKTVNCNITEIFSMNEKISDKFDQIRSTLFFKIFKINFDTSCNFWTQNMICNFHTCSVCQCEENEVPLPWKQDSENDDIDKNIDEKFYQWVEKYNYSSPHWIVESEIDSKNGIYVNIEKNPEAFTGYQGQHIWNAIYFENCFKEANNFNFNVEQLCKEEKTFYKIISGLHSNINIHLSKNYLNLSNNKTYYNTSMLHERLLSHPDRINNLFFLYSLLLKAFFKAESLIKNYNFYTGNDKEDNKTISYLNELYNLDPLGKFGQVRDLCENCLGRELSFNTNSQNLDNFFNFNPFKLDELKMRFRNITQIIDCVSCQKCKLHGKLQIYGIATMMKILFSKEDSSIRKKNNLSEFKMKFKRNEIISFVNLVGKVSKSIKYLWESENKEFLNIINQGKIDNGDSGMKLFIIFFSTLVLFVLVTTNKYYLSNRNKLAIQNRMIRVPIVKDDKMSKKEN